MSSQLASLSRHTLRQVKFVIPGGLITYGLGTYHELASLLDSSHAAHSWARSTALAALALGMLNVTLFMYILLIPWIHGRTINYSTWRQSPILSRVIPILTASIAAGWSLLTFLLGRYSSLGYFKGVIAAVGLYILTLGLIGLIPAPKRRLA